MNAKLHIQQILLTLFLLGIFFLPFNSYQGLGFLGEFRADSCFLFFLAAALLLVVNILATSKISLPVKHPLFQIVLLFILWCLITALLNSTDILGYYFKQTSGVNRFMRQYMALLISSLILFITYINIFRKIDPYRLFIKIRWFMLMSFAVVTVYTVLEILVIKLKIFALQPLLELFDFFPFTEVKLDFRNSRISSVTFEPPAFALYLLTIAGWMFSYIITHRTLFKYVPALLVIIFGFLSGSRAALLIIFVQAIVFMFYLLRQRKYHVHFKRLMQYAVIIGVLVLIFGGKKIGEYVYERATSFGIEHEKHAVSNKSRFGIQYTLGLIFLKSPLYGVGYGQQAFIAKDLYPKWATENNWEFRLLFLNEEHKSFPPSYNIYLRLLAETGIVGLLLFLLLLGSAIYYAHRFISKDLTTGTIALVILISLLGFALNWLKMDTFRVFGFWINLALLLVLSKNMVSNKMAAVKESHEE